jgi:hypothetical protein
VTDAAAVRDALAGVQSAFDEAARRRVGLARVLARTPVSPGSEAARDALVEAVLRREAADASDEGGAAERMAAVARQESAAREARARLVEAGETGAIAVAGSIDATWPWAFGVSDRLVRGLDGRAPAEIVTALRAYVDALQTTDAQRVESAAAALERVVTRRLAEKP